MGKHIPQRTCIGCGARLSKRELVRVVRTPQGEVDIDWTGKKSGRGAYFCKNPRCWEQGLKKARLDHALRGQLSPQTRERLLALSKTLGVMG